jgi:hypothetical protein
MEGGTYPSSPGIELLTFTHRSIFEHFEDNLDSEIRKFFDSFDTQTAYTQCLLIELRLGESNTASRLNCLLRMLKQYIVHTVSNSWGFWKTTFKNRNKSSPIYLNYLAS